MAQFLSEDEVPKKHIPRIIEKLKALLKGRAEILNFLDKIGASSGLKQRPTLQA